MNYAGFGKRLLAYLIDGVIIGLAGGILAVFFGYYFYLIFGWLLGALYFILMEGGTWQATLGKRAMGLIVTDMNGDPISYGTATLRYLGKFVSSLILGIGYLMAAFTENHQALHDKIASTLVLCAAPAGNTRYSSQGAGSPAPPSMASPGTGRCIVGISGEFAGRSVQLLPGGTMIGRDSVACQIALSASAPGISRHHCQVNYNPQTGLFIINDLGSTYGTYLMNGMRIPSGQPAALRPGERFYAGSQANVFEVR